MRRTLDEQEAVRLGRYDSQPTGVTRIDRETLEGVMRDDVFLAADGRALAHDPINFLMLTRRGARRA